MSNKKIVSLEELTEGAAGETKETLMEEIRKHFPDAVMNKALMQNKTLTLSWLVDGLLLRGGSSLVVAEPKTGKSVLARQIALAVSQGQDIFNREVKRGLVFYISVEDHPALIKEHMKNMGVKEDDSIMWSLGRITGLKFKEAIEFICKKVRPSLIVIDTMFKVFKTNDINDYNTMIESLQQVTEIVRNYKSHIMYIHHLNKGGGKTKQFGEVMGGHQAPSLSRVMGSMGIAGEMDSIITLSRSGDSRFIDSSYSRCGRKLDNELLFWDIKKGCYVLNDI